MVNVKSRQKRSKSMKPLTSLPQNLRIEMKNHLLPFVTSLGTAFSSLPECPEGHLVNLLPPRLFKTPLFFWDHHASDASAHLSLETYSCLCALPPSSVGCGSTMAGWVLGAIWKSKEGPANLTQLRGRWVGAAERQRQRKCGIFSNG